MAGMDLTTLITDLGGLSDAAEKMGVKRTTLGMWRKRGRIPPARVPEVAHALAIKPEVLWPALSGRPMSEAA